MWSSHSYNLFICRAEENKTSATIPVQSTRWQEIEERVGEVVRGDIHVSNKKWSANFRFIEMKCIHRVCVMFCVRSFPNDARAVCFFCRISPCRSSLEWWRWWESLARWVHECVVYVCECIFAEKRNWNGSSYVIRCIWVLPLPLSQLLPCHCAIRIYILIFNFCCELRFFCFRSSFCIMIHWDLKWRHTLNERVFSTRHTHTHPNCVSSPSAPFSWAIYRFAKYWFRWRIWSFEFFHVRVKKWNSNFFFLPLNVRRG